VQALCGGGTAFAHVKKIPALQGMEDECNEELVRSWSVVTAQ
jgi:hypothetical protein